MGGQDKQLESDWSGLPAEHQAGDQPQPLHSDRRQELQPGRSQGRPRPRAGELVWPPAISRRLLSVFSSISFTSGIKKFINLSGFTGSHTFPSFNSFSASTICNKYDSNKLISVYEFKYIRV